MAFQSHAAIAAAIAARISTTNAFAQVLHAPAAGTNELLDMLETVTTLPVAAISAVHAVYAEHASYRTISPQIIVASTFQRGAQNETEALSSLAAVVENLFLPDFSNGRVESAVLGIHFQIKEIAPLNPGELYRACSITLEGVELNILP